LAALESYLGNDNLHVGNYKGLSISHSDHTKIHTPHRSFTLSNILYVPHITKHLLSVQKFCLDKKFILNFTPLGFISRISTPMKYSSQVRVKMVFMLCLGLPSRQFLKLIGLLDLCFYIFMASLTRSSYFSYFSIVNLKNKIFCN
jgi:hypothetical protein